jgi:beta-N-acetylhexosaminidase
MDTISNIGQNIIVGMPDATPTQEFYSFIKDYNIGGVLFLGKNYDSFENLISTINKLQDSSRIFPLFTSVDHEGGRVQRFKAPFTVLPSYRTIAATKTPKELFDIFGMIARELLSCGINFNLAPVVDMTEETNGVIGDRSAGTNMEKVEEVISATIRGFVKAKILCCAKHFPGHGCTNIDSHLELPSSDKTMQDLLTYEISPFKKATRAGVSAIMMSHIMFKNIDTLPASLSSKFIYDIIRKEFRFIKLVITDDISMGAISKHYSAEEAFELAIRAGNDIVIHSSSDIDHLANLIDSISKKATEDPDLRNYFASSQARIKEIKKDVPRNRINPETALKVLESSELKKIFL